MRSTWPLYLQRLMLTCVALIFALDLPGLAPAAGPSDVAGTWTWTWKDSEKKEHKHVLDIEAAGDKLTGRERFDDGEAVKVDDLVVRGMEISFVVTRDGRRAEYQGKIASGKTINGMVNVTNKGQSNEYTWAAEKVKVDAK